MKYIAILKFYFYSALSNTSHSSNKIKESKLVASGKTPSIKSYHDTLLNRFAGLKDFVQVMPDDWHDKNQSNS